tara:strand:- start:1095 stop:5216 length:4122 start_codon:yes stop_codon:yes gene_type:complete
MFNKFSQSQRNYDKISFINALEKVVPDIYLDEDITLSGTRVNPTSQIINAHLKTIENIASILPVSSLQDTNQFSAIGNSSGISQYFVKQNGLTKIDPREFENNILALQGKSFSYFQTSSEFSSYLEDFLPTIKLNYPTATFTGVGTDSSAVHEYLISNLSWLYFLNTTGVGGCSVAPSSIARDLLVTKTFRGQRINLNDGIKGLSEYIFNNYEDQSSWQTLSIIPSDYLPSAFLTPSSQYTSGIQQLDKWKTMVDVVYSPAIMDESNVDVKKAIDDFLPNSTLLKDRTSNGPFYNLLRAFSYAMMDVSEDVEKLSVLYDLEQCPDDLLPELAKLIGWRLYGHEPNRWRVQLYNAVDIYKRAGTKQSIQIATNSVFSKNVFDVSSKIHELWESYIPHLIYYSIATESPYFLDLNSWTETTANSMGVDNYSSSSMDDNLKMVVDHILSRLQRMFPKLFILGNNPFPTTDPNFRFRYRGKTTFMPPWEEIPYYSNCCVSEKFVEVLEDELACFGVRNEFALQVGKYIRGNTIRAHDYVREGNQFLMFTSGVNYPPNWDRLLSNISVNRTEFLSLWSGKSSHYKLMLEADSFDFAKNTINFDSKNAVGILGRVANDFAPAYAIAKVMLVASGIDDYTNSSVRLNYLGLDKSDEFAGGWVSSVFNNKSIYGMNMPAGTLFSRYDLNNISDVSADSNIGLSYPRNAFRRRDLKNILPRHGFYDRTGFNGPVSWDPSSLEYSLNTLQSNIGSNLSSLGYLPLGYIPSAGAFLPITEYSSIPEVYNGCQTLSVSNSFSGVDVSNTFPCRGLSGLGSDAKNTQYEARADRYVDRGQLDPIVAIMHSIEEKRKLLIGTSSVNTLLSDGSTSSLFSGTLNWKNNNQSWANSSTEFSGAFPNSSQDYDRFKFSRGIHQLYKDYTKHFNRHHTRLTLLDEDGPHILAHAFGSVFSNSNFDNYGHAVNNFPNVIASATTSALPLLNGENLFTLAATGLYETTLHTTATNSLAVPTQFAGKDVVKEFRNNTVISGVDLVQTSGGSVNNSFTFYNIDYSHAKINHPNFSINNPLVKLKSINGFPRIRYSTKGANIPTESGLSVTKNLLIGEHDFRFGVKYSGGTSDGLQTGGVGVGVWVHTGYEDGHFWSFNKKGVWEYVNASDINTNMLFGEHIHSHTLEHKDRLLDKNTNSTRCLDALAAGERDVIMSFIEDEFETFYINFSTNNRPICVPERYYKKYKQVHREDQDYIIEVFMLPGANLEKFVILDNVNLLDVTQNLRTMLPGFGNRTGLPEDIDPLCKIQRINLTKREVLNIIKYFNKISGSTFRRADASRVASNTSSFLEANGGSRINYRQNYSWPNYYKTIGNDTAAADNISSNEFLIMDVSG